MYICRHFPRGCIKEVEGVRRVYVAIGNGIIFTTRSLVEYILNSKAQGITTYLVLMLGFVRCMHSIGAVLG